ncbi:MAG: Anaerobic glycerol-3-phosphate dehydrogenase subunit C [Alphaproteobacteria bacterium MarineAlpha2_Bin1]|nr:MAG: Anaerobic glycerol-3-phosphate dehydrogenase subunit C [Alphaproteobacteria bacterium MarineAlpha2_Bin1]
MSSKEGGLGAPIRHPLYWKEESFTDTSQLDTEMRRVFDVCHSCRRCFNLCDSFPRLFDLIDDSDSGELESVNSANFKSVEEACTLCDLCFLSKCPYVPPHEFNIDFPHLMLRYRYSQKIKKTGLSLVNKIMLNTDLTGKIGSYFAPILNWLFSKKNKLVRKFLQISAGIHKEAKLPEFHWKTFNKLFNKYRYKNQNRLGIHKRKVLVYTTCFVNYNMPSVASAALTVLQKNNIIVEFIYPECCGMPKLEAGDLQSVVSKARRISNKLLPWVDKGYEILTLTPSCGLMIKSEWQLLDPDNKKLKKISSATKDICEYISEFSKDNDFIFGKNNIKKNISLHIACHTKAQNIGIKSADMLRNIPDLNINIVDKCSGHGGSFGVKKNTYPLAKKYGKIASRKISSSEDTVIVSECPLAAQHLREVKNETNNNKTILNTYHPIEILAESYTDE